MKRKGCRHTTGRRIGRSEGNEQNRAEVGCLMLVLIPPQEKQVCSSCKSNQKLQTLTSQASQLGCVVLAIWGYTSFHNAPSLSLTAFMNASWNSGLHAVRSLPFLKFQNLVERTVSSCFIKKYLNKTKLHQDPLYTRFAPFAYIFMPSSSVDAPEHFLPTFRSRSLLYEWIYNEEEFLLNLSS